MLIVINLVSNFHAFMEQELSLPYPKISVFTFESYPTYSNHAYIYVLVSEILSQPVLFMQER
jgi:hypothetical protein